MALQSLTAGKLAGTGFEPNRPNILVIRDDDIKYWDVRAYNHGMIGWTPSIDQHREGRCVVTGWYGKQKPHQAARHSSRAKRIPQRQAQVGLPGAKEGLQARDVTLAQLL
jgi:arylsulfatase A-like enzyme